MPATTASRQRGLGLIEVLIAILVLSVGLLGLAGMQGRSLAKNHSAYLRSQAITLSHEIGERMRVNRQAALNGDYDLALDAEAPGNNSLADKDVSGWLAALQATLPAGDGSLSHSGNSFTVTVQWDDSRGAEDLMQFVTVVEL
ncbi:type IV pilus modification protein PilV [Pistricoccus aurantiacus]|uniref:type IV pilus modification protein PilV n=1 Tax=Pistricoccus aurantiacus TaxID=1883414 RepID=UPI0036457C93